MGRMKQLWQDERDARSQAFFDEAVKDGLSLSEAEEYAIDEMEKYDEANGQFGVGC